MSKPTEIEKKIAERLNETSMPKDGVMTLALRMEDEVLRGILRELMERRLRAEYLGLSSITGRTENEERID